MTFSAESHYRWSNAHHVIYFVECILKDGTLIENLTITKTLELMLILYAGCLGLSPVFSAKIRSKCVSQLKIAKNSLKTNIFGIQGHRCWYPGKLVSSACYDMQHVCVYLQPFLC